MLMPSDSLSAADWLRARRALAVELVVVAVAAAALAALAPRVEAGGPPARLLYVVAIALVSTTLVHGALLALSLFEWECPRCRQYYCGSHLFRATCHSCGHAAAEARSLASRTRRPTAP